MSKCPNVVVIGTGEYVTGFGPDQATRSDKPSGVVLLSLLELRRQKRINKITLCGQDGSRFPLIRAHLSERIDKRYEGLSTSDIRTMPDDGCVNNEAWKLALGTLSRGDAVIIATPDHLHYEMAHLAQQNGLHVLVVKPLVKTLADHINLATLGGDSMILVEMHKRLDPFYQDARERARELGDFSYMHAYMSQPKSQLETFRAWAGLNSDISYYLNTHHIDLHAWMMAGRGRPIAVSASAAQGVGQRILDREIEDTITLKVDWENLPSGHRGVAVYTASWIAPRAEVHSQQRFFYLGHGGEIAVDQAHRGYRVATDEDGYSHPNPLFMQYRGINGHFIGTGAYGFRSIEEFIARIEERRGARHVAAHLHSLPTAAESLPVTAILEAGRRSLDQGGLPIGIVYAADAPFAPTGLRNAVL